MPTYLFCGKPGVGKSTTSIILENFSGGKRFGTDDIRNKLFPRVPDSLYLDNLPPEQIWPALAKWIHSSLLSEIDMLIALTPTRIFAPTRQIFPPPDLLKEVNYWKRISKAQSNQVYATILAEAEEYLKQLEPGERDSKIAILDGTFGLSAVEHGRKDFVSILSQYGPVYAIQITCPTTVAKSHLSARKQGVDDPGSTLANVSWIYDITSFEDIQEEEGFVAAISYDTYSQEISRIFGTPDEKLMEQLSQLREEINKGTTPTNLISI